MLPMTRPPQAAMQRPLPLVLLAIPATLVAGDPARRIAADRRPGGCLCGQHHHGEGGCIIDRVALRRWNRHMSAVWLTERTGLRVRGPGGVVR
jgi:hypothetical protein